jgi:hemerythrin-like domain-containing protein|tara:strand:+ start:219 stop:494 length:276 start_codon:yes stop_codon:yes gene_type:complete
MKVTKFLNIDIEPAPAELELSVEMRCREIMKSNDIDNIKRYCTHLVRHQMDQDVFLASMLGRLIELEANVVVKQVRKEKKTNPIKKFFRIP